MLFIKRLSLSLALAMLALSPASLYACPFDSDCHLYTVVCYADPDCQGCPQKITLSIYICGYSGGIVEYCTRGCCICA